MTNNSSIIAPHTKDLPVPIHQDENVSAQPPPPPTTTTTTMAPCPPDSRSSVADLRECYAATRMASVLTEMSDGAVDELNESIHRQLNALSEKQRKLIEEEPLFEDRRIELEGCEKILKALTDWEKERLADPDMPLRHFRAEKGDVNSAIKKIKATIAWREEFGVAKIRNCFNKDGDEEMRNLLSSENQTGKVYVRGYDKEGRAIVYLRPSRDASKSEVNKMRNLVYNLERAIACTERKSGRERYNIVIDYTGFRMRNSPPLSTAKFTLDILQKHYPERLHRAYLCNPPVIFRTFWAMLKPFIDPVTKEKIVFCHGSAGVDTLQENFDLDTMEKCVGGTKEVRPFDPKEYLAAPLDVTFDEQHDPAELVVERLSRFSETAVDMIRSVEKASEVDARKTVVRRSSSISLMTGTF